MDVIESSVCVRPQLQEKISQMSTNSDCTVAFILQYSKNNTLLVQDFAKIWTKLITTGYQNHNGQVTLHQVIY